VSVHDDAAGTALVPAFVAAGYDHEVIVTMVHSGAPVPPPAYDVDEVSVDTLRPALVHDWRLLLPDASDAQIAQLADRTALYGRAAEAVLLAVFDDGLLAAHADLFLDRGAAVAQFEHLATRNEYQGRGHGTALVHDALRRSAAARCDLVFLTADLDDWPREWYGRLGFTEVDRTHHFERN
jgi:GNAT superfamily N-acetyltransferase